VLRCSAHHGPEVKAEALALAITAGSRQQHSGTISRPGSSCLGYRGRSGGLRHPLLFPGWPPEDHTADEQVEVVAELAQSSLDTLGLKPGMIKPLNREAETPEQQKVLAKERIKGNELLCRRGGHFVGSDYSVAWRFDQRRRAAIGKVFVRSFLRRASRAAYFLWSRWLRCGTEDSGLSRESPIVIFAPAFVGAEVVPNSGWLKVEIALKTSHPGGPSLCELFALQRGDQIKPPHHKEAPAAVWVRTAGAGGTLCR
jgi:hypothetical protein